jgi:type VI secretion system protein ImpD/type VI secretion system protein ImpC
MDGVTAESSGLDVTTLAVAPDTNAPPPEPEPEELSIRSFTLAGRFFGRMYSGEAEALTAFTVERSAVGALSAWFGQATFDSLVAHDGSRAGAAEARARLEEAVDRDLVTIDAMISAQLDMLLWNDRMRRLEGSWRGLHWLCNRVQPGTKVKVKLLLARWAEICRDFERAIEFDQSNIFKKIYEEEFGTAGGEPFGMLACDYQVRPAPGPGSPTDDVTALDALAAVAAASFSPAVIAAHPALIGLDHFSELGASADPTEAMRGVERRRWRSLQERDDSRFLSVLLPRVLARPPWPDDGTRPDRFRYRPDPSGEQARAWMSPVFPLAATAMRAFSSWGWPADIRGATVNREATGGVVEDLPFELLPSDPRRPLPRGPDLPPRRAHDLPDPPPGPPRPPTEVALTDDQEKLLVEAGIIPLIGLEGLPEAAFAAAPSLHRPPRMTTDIANANQRLSAQFNAILCVSRFAHCIKLMGRAMVGSFQTANDIQLRLQQWITKFASQNSGSNGDLGARHPLREARVQVAEVPGKPGTFGCVIQMQPHYQLDEVGAAFRLVTDLNKSRNAA